MGYTQRDGISGSLCMGCNRRVQPGEAHLREGGQVHSLFFRPPVPTPPPPHPTSPSPTPPPDFATTLHFHSWRVHPLPPPPACARACTQFSVLVWSHCAPVERVPPAKSCGLPCLVHLVVASLELARVVCLRAAGQFWFVFADLQYVSNVLNIGKQIQKAII